MAGKLQDREAKKLELDCVFLSPFCQSLSFIGKFNPLTFKLITNKERIIFAI